MNDAERAFISRVEKMLLKPAPREKTPSAIPAAVLVPVVFRDDAPHLIFTLRTKNLSQHKGQISFPGGSVEPGDKGPTAAALREAEEETGLLPEHVRTLGCMSELVTVTNFSVTPVVGIVDPGARLTPNAQEVDEIFELCVFEFQNPAQHSTRPFEHKGAVRQVHYYEIGTRVIWGLTAEIVHRLTSCLEPPLLRSFEQSRR